MTQTHLPISLPASGQPLIDAIKGHEQPRRYTPPLVQGAPGPCGCGCALTPENSYGYAVVEFAEEVLGIKLLPWQRWLLIHVGELLPDGLPRFKEVLILIGRQNGKTFLLNILTLYWLFVDQVELVMGMSTNLDTAKEAWQKACNLVLNNSYLSSLINPKKNIKKAAGQQTLEVPLTEFTYSRYKIAASNATGGRGFTIDRLIMDELREHTDWTAYDAATPATSAVDDAQIIYITNQGPEDAVVLHTLHEAALTQLETGHGFTDFGLFEWSAPDGSILTDPSSWAFANPSLGYTVMADKLKGRADRAIEKGGDLEASFKTNYLCQRVMSMKAAIHPDRWAACYKPDISLKGLDRNEIQYCLDLSWSRTHATLAAAGNVDDVPHVGMVHEWRDRATGNIMRDIKALVKKYDIKNLSVLPNGPAADFAKALQALRIPGLKVHVINELADVCMMFADLVHSGNVTHHSIDLPEKKDNEILTRQIIATERKDVGARYVFDRKNHDNCDAVYAIAGAVFQLKTTPALPTPVVYSIKPREGS